MVTCNANAFKIFSLHKLGCNEIGWNRKLLPEWAAEFQQMKMSFCHCYKLNLLVPYFPIWNHRQCWLHQDLNPKNIHHSCTVSINDSIKLIHMVGTRLIHITLQHHFLVATDGSKKVSVAGFILRYPCLENVYKVASQILNLRSNKKLNLRSSKRIPWVFEWHFYLNLERLYQKTTTCLNWAGMKIHV